MIVIGIAKVIGNTNTAIGSADIGYAVFAAVPLPHNPRPRPVGCELTEANGQRWFNASVVGLVIGGYRKLEASRPSRDVGNLACHGGVLRSWFGSNLGLITRVNFC